MDKLYLIKLLFRILNKHVCFLFKQNKRQKLKYNDRFIFYFHILTLYYFKYYNLIECSLSNIHACKASWCVHQMLLYLLVTGCSSSTVFSSTVSPPNTLADARSKPSSHSHTTVYIGNPALLTVSSYNRNSSSFNYIRQMYTRQCNIL